MKKIIALLLLTASLISLAACGNVRTPAPTTTAVTTTPGAGTTLPPVTTPPTTTEPPAPELSDAERVSLLLAELEAAPSFSFSGELSLSLPQDGDGGYATDQYYASGSLSDGDLSAVGTKNGTLPFSAILSQMTLTYTEGETPLSYTAAELLSRIPELSVNLDRADRALASLVHYLTAYGAIVDAWLAERDIAADSIDLLSAVDLMIGIFSSLAAEVGYTPDVSAVGSNGDLRKLIPALVTVTPAESGGYTVSFQLNPILRLLREMLTETSLKLNQTVSALIDGAFGEGTASDLLMRLAMISGSSKLSVLTAEIEKIVLTARMTMDDFYAIASALISKNMTVGVTASELKSILRENRNKTVDSVISRFASDQTYTGLVELIASILSKTPTQLYAERADEGAAAPSLSDRIAELDTYLVNAEELFSLSISTLCSAEMKPASLSVLCSVFMENLALSFSLSANPAEAE